MSERITSTTLTKFIRQPLHIQLNWYDNNKFTDILEFNHNNTFYGIKKKYDKGKLCEWVIWCGGINKDGIDKLCLGPIGLKKWIEEEHGNKSTRPHGYYKEFDLPLSLYNKTTASLTRGNKYNRSLQNERAIELNDNSVELIKTINKWEYIQETGEIICLYY
jgi:hypothetical protein